MPLVYGLAKNSADKLKELEVLGLNVGGGAGVELVVGGAGEQTEVRVKRRLDAVLQKLLEHAVLVDARLVKPLVVDKLDLDRVLERSPKCKATRIGSSGSRFLHAKFAWSNGLHRGCPTVRNPPVKNGSTEEVKLR